MSLIPPGAEPEEPLVSCVVATRDRWPLLQRALDSIRSQVGPSFEILVVDDGSTDETPRLGPSLEGVRYLRLGGEGAAAARNRGGRAARGRWLAFLDDDDEWLPGKLALQLAWIQDRGLDLGCTGWLRRRPDGSEEPGGFEGAEGVQPWERLLQGNFAPTPTVMIRRALFEECGGFDPALRTAEDWDLWLRAARARGIGYLPEVLTRVHVQGGASLTGDREGLWRDALRVQERHLAGAGTLAPGWRRPVLRALADGRLRAAGAALRRGDGRQALLDLGSALRSDPLYCLRCLVRLLVQGMGLR